MILKNTVFGRLRKFLRVKLQVNKAVTEDSSLGASPMGFDDTFIQTEFMQRLNLWFSDYLTNAFVSVDWDGHTMLGAVTKDIMDSSRITTPDQYVQHVTGLTETALDKAAGEGAQDVPAGDRARVRDAMNQELDPLLFRAIDQSDLAGGRETIVANVTGKMLI